MRAYEAGISTTNFHPCLAKQSPPELDFHQSLAVLRKERALIQQALADLARMPIFRLRRDESGQSQLAGAWSVSANLLPFEAVSRLHPEKMKLLGSAIKSLVRRNTVKPAERRVTADSGGTTQ